MSLGNQSGTPLAWQSATLLTVVMVPVTAAVVLECWFSAPESVRFPLRALGVGSFLALLVWKSRSATPSGAICGGLFAAALLLVTEGWHTPFWPLLGLLLLTLWATRFGRARKEELGVAEGRHGRNAAQVAANLGVGALAAVSLRFSLSSAAPRVLHGGALRLALAAALAEAAGDTLSSELGEVLGGEPHLITTFSRVPAGTDGAISIAGTLAGISGAGLITLVAAIAMAFTPLEGAIVLMAAVTGLFVDSWLGALLERRGWLNNDAVNFLSTLAAAAIAYLTR